MKNTEKLVRGSQWREQGLVKTMEPWRRLEKPAEKKNSEQKNSLNNSNEPTGFKKWNMPDEQHGYIKSKKHDFL